MKKIAIILILILFMTNHVSAHNKPLSQGEMIQLANLTASSKLTIDHWQVTLKENIPKARLQDYINEWKNSYLDTYSEDENVIKYTFRNVHKNENLVESYIVIIPKNSSYQSELIAVVSGQDWNTTTKHKYQELQKSIIRHYFSENATKFACLTTASDDTIKGVYLINSVKEKLQLQQITTQTDNVEKSMHKKIIYGYTPLWTQNFNILDKPVNVNIAITNTTNGETKLTIGTPILITEY
ncbi:hypothetical protein CFK37_07915 [Virgibacillus phasianinus]|uniref:TATA-box binding n=1 Tax=Virgibacillus phasianinus TaxID=2017483 RepID=A0A220U2W0_9BACI|nr:YwmB family TATA-box binding protein [Virgibacillus phasianinus]ASK62093.1 hypothetical protein CFK37_07915 [Virgibacillus phasianinus]